jgi:BRCT domain type II-containing protein
MKKLQPTRAWQMQAHHREIPKGVSETVPNQALSIQDILARSLAGMTPAVERQGGFMTAEDDFDAYDLEALRRMDVYELNETLDAVNQVVKDRSAELEKFRAAEAAVRAEQEKEEKEILEAHRAAKKKKEAPPAPPVN